MSIRTFLAIELTPAIRATLSQVQQRLKSSLPPISWVKPESLHLTIKFLGDVNHDQVEPIRLAIGSWAKEFSPFVLDIHGIGAFPRLQVPRVVWAGISGQVDLLQELVSNVDRALASMGFPPESKPFHPHLTLARVKQRSREVGVALLKTDILEVPPSFGTLPVDRVCLFKSELTPQGSVYHQLWEVPLSK